jgi:hypothetical protein
VVTGRQSGSATICGISGSGVSGAKIWVHHMFSTRATARDSGTCSHSDILGLAFATAVRLQGGGRAKGMGGSAEPYRKIDGRGL